LPSNDRSVSHLTQYKLLHYLGKADQAKYALKETENSFHRTSSTDLDAASLDFILVFLEPIKSRKERPAHSHPPAAPLPPPLSDTGEV